MSLAAYLNSKYKNTFIASGGVVFFVTGVVDARKKKIEPPDDHIIPNGDIPEPEMFAQALEPNNDQRINDADWPYMKFNAVALNGEEDRWRTENRILSPDSIIPFPESSFVDYGGFCYYFSRVPVRQFRRALSPDTAIFVNAWSRWWAQVGNPSEFNLFRALISTKTYPSKYILTAANDLQIKKTIYNLFYPKRLSLTEDFDKIENRLGTAIGNKFAVMYDNNGKLSLFYLFNKVAEIENARKLRVTDHIFYQEILDFVKENEINLSIS